MEETEIIERDFPYLQSLLTFYGKGYTKEQVLQLIAELKEREPSEIIAGLERKP
jgi:hypothetical protein